MSDKLTVNPERVRGLGDIVSHKTISDFDVHNVSLSSGSATIDDDTIPVWTGSYLAGSSFSDVSFDRCYPSVETEAVIGFTLLHSTGTAITGATITVFVNDVLDGTCTTNGSGEATYTVDLTEDTVSLYKIKMVYSGNSNVAGCFQNLHFWHGDILGLTLISDRNPVGMPNDSHLLATLSGTDIEGNVCGIPAQNVMIFEEYTPGVRLTSNKHVVGSGETAILTAELYDTVDGSRVCLPNQTVDIYEEYTPGIVVEATKQIIEEGETVTLYGQLIDASDGSKLCMAGETVYLYEEYTPDIRLSSNPVICEDGDDVTITAQFVDKVDGSLVALSGESIEIYEDYHPNVSVSSNHDIISTGETATLTATVLDDDGSAVSGETVEIYEEYTLGVKCSGNKRIIGDGETVTLTGQLIDSTDGSLLSLSGETVDIIQEFDEVYLVDITYGGSSGTRWAVTAHVTNQYGDNKRGVKVRFRKDNTWVQVTTNSNGIASALISNSWEYMDVLLPDIYGDNVMETIIFDYTPVVTSVVLTVSPTSVTFGETVTFSPVVQDQKGNPMRGELVTIYDGGTSMRSGKTNPMGVYNFFKSNLSVGSHTITATCGTITSSSVTVTVTGI